MVRGSFRPEGNLTLPQDFYLQLRNWILEVEQELQSLRTARELSVWEQGQCCGGGYMPGQSGKNNDPGVFPFRVMFRNPGPNAIGSTQELIVCGANSTTDNETESLIFGGPGKMYSFEETIVPVTGTGNIYLIVNLDAASPGYLSARVEFGESAPGATTLSYVVILAHIGNTPGGFMKITQLQYGHIYIAGRIV